MRRPHRSTIIPAVVAATLALVLPMGPVGASVDPDDQGLAQQGVIVPGDVPATWTVAPRSTSGDDAELAAAKKIPTCSGYVAFEKSNNARTSAKSQNFRSTTDQIHNSVYVYASDAAAAKAMRSLGPPKTAGKCLSALLKKAVAARYRTDENVTRTRVRVEPADVSTAQVDGVAFGGGWQVTMKDGTTQGRLIALIASQVGRVIVTYSADADPSSSEVADVLQGALAATLTRVEAAQ